MKKNFKKLSLIILFALTLLIFVGCNKKDDIPEEGEKRFTDNNEAEETQTIKENIPLTITSDEIEGSEEKVDEAINENKNESYFNFDEDGDGFSFKFSTSMEDIIENTDITFNENIVVEVPENDSTDSSNKKQEGNKINDLPIRRDEISQEFLPIGTVVLLKDSTKKVIIIGHNQIEVGNEEVLYDYSGSVFPEGYLGADSTYLFNNENIKDIYYLGYEDNNNNPIIHDKSTSEILPVGSVVLLDNSTAKVMIIGVCQIDMDEEIWDYSACIYPNGYLGANYTYLFNNNQIKEVYHLGYQDSEQEQISELAKNMLASLRSN